MQLDADDYGFTRRRSDYWPTDDIASLAQHLRPDKGETLDLILREKIYLLQSRRGYRVNTDSHVLAYFASKIYSKRGRLRVPLRVLDLGAGVGLASILFAKANKPSSLHLLELQGQLVNRARRNLQLNDLKGHVLRHDLRGGLIPEPLKGDFDVVLMNPPFYRLGEKRPPRLREKFLARMETSAPFSDFVSAASAALDDRNRNAFLAVIHDRRETARLEPVFKSNKLCIVESCEMIHAPGEPGTRILFALQRDRRTSVLEVERSETSNSHRKLSASTSPPIPSHPPLALHKNTDNRSEYSPELEEFFHNLPNPSLRIGRLKEQVDFS